MNCYVAQYLDNNVKWKSVDDLASVSRQSNRRRLLAGEALLVLKLELGQPRAGSEQLEQRTCSAKTLRVP